MLIITTEKHETTSQGVKSFFRAIEFSWGTFLPKKSLRIRDQIS